MTLGEGLFLALSIAGWLLVLVGIVKLFWPP